MVTIQQATQNVMNFAREALGPERTQGKRLEEIELAIENDERVWHITLSMLGSPDPQEGPAGAISAVLNFGGSKREYKTFSVLKDTGE
jgi:hypothetical protein